MKDITIIVPVHKYDKEIKQMLTNAFNSVKKNVKFYKTVGELSIMVVGPLDVTKHIEEDFGEKYSIKYCVNNGNTDFCSQINFAAEQIDTEHFSILEFDDEYKDKWFKMAHDYFYTNENVSLFLPINILTDTEREQFQFVNEIAWTSTFSNKLGYLDFDCLQDYSSFNLTGGIFNTEDFKAIGGFKPSIKVAFNYEFLLRLAKKELEIFVVPKEGYVHIIGRKDSLTDEYNKTLTRDEIRKWFDLAKTEYAFTQDRKVTIDKIKEEEVK